MSRRSGRLWRTARSSRCRQTTLPSASKARRPADATTSRRSRTGCPVSRRVSRSCSPKASSAVGSPRNALSSSRPLLPARIFGLTSKGRIEPGADADVIVVDPAREVDITASVLHSDVDYSPYEGMTLNGFPTWTISRGEVIVDDGCAHGQAGARSTRRSGADRPGHASLILGIGDRADQRVCTDDRRGSYGIRSSRTSSMIPKKQHHSPSSTDGRERSPKTTPSSGATTSAVTVP